MTDMRETIMTAIEFEKFGVEYYKRFEELVAEKEAKLLMRSLASDEAEHASILARQLQALGGETKKPSEKDVEKGLSEIFPERAAKESIDIRDSIAAIKLGIKTEERSVDFYSKSAAEASPELRGVFGRLEAMEREHLRLLQENLHFLESDGAWYGYVPILEG